MDESDLNNTSIVSDLVAAESVKTADDHPKSWGLHILYDNTGDAKPGSLAIEFVLEHRDDAPILI